MGSSVNVRGAFSSERLNYTALDSKDEEAFNFAYEHLFNDPEMFFQTANTVLKPEDRATAEKYFDAMARGAISVAIRLRPDADNSQGQRNWGEAEVPFPKSKGRVIGFASLDSLAIPHHRSTTLGLAIAPEFQGQGYGTEACNWIIDAGFRRINLHSIALTVFSYNPALKLYERLGFKVEGRRREALWYDGKWHDKILMSMLEDEWRELRGMN